MFLMLGKVGRARGSRIEVSVSPKSGRVGPSAHRPVPDHLPVFVSICVRVFFKFVSFGFLI